MIIIKLNELFPYDTSGRVLETISGLFSEEASESLQKELLENS